MFNYFGIFDLSTPDLLIILGIILLLFGAKKLPELSRSLGTSARELRKGFTDLQEAHGELKEEVKQVAVSTTPSITTNNTSISAPSTVQPAIQQERPSTPIQL
jgi:sec-independent protein translocase protein TatA